MANNSILLKTNRKLLSISELPQTSNNIELVKDIGFHRPLEAIPIEITGIWEGRNIGKNFH